MGQTSETNSLEVRWFDTGEPPRALTEWVTGLGETDTAQRTDLYFPPLDPVFNLKLRGGTGDSVEVKHRLGSGRRHSFSPSVTGTVEQWYKWSFSLDHTSRLWTADPTGLWVPVEKTRVLYPFENADRASLDESITDTDVTAHVEVTEVTALSTTGWTCGVEVAGQSDELEAVFTAVESALFGETFPLELAADQSIGYVEWLGRLAADREPDSDVLVPSNR
jgi:hypothetical protein